MRGMQKMISLCLALCLAISMVPVQIFAEETAAETAVTETTVAATEMTLPTEAAEETTASTEMTEEITVPTETEKETTATEETTVPETGTLTVTDEAVGAEVTTSGTCGENLTWLLDSEGVLTISGNGDMSDYYYNGLSGAPWFRSRGQILHVVVENGISSIGNCAFDSCSNLKSIQIPDSVTRIGDDAFEGCSSLSSIVLSENITEIGSYAFDNCTSLSSITIPSSLSSIGTGVFCNCSGVTDVVIQDGIEALSQNMFMKCTGLICIVIPDGVQSIGMGAFNECTSLTSISIPDSVTSIGQFAFEYCTSLTDIYYTGDESQWKLLLENSGSNNDPLLNAEIHCSGITADTELITGTCGDNLTWTFEKETGTLTVSGTGDLANGNRFRDYWDDSNLVDKGEIRSVIIEEGVTSIGDDVFNFCTSLESVTLPEGLLTIGEWAFRHCAMTTIDLPETLTFIGDSAFWSCENLTSIVIPKSVQTIHFSAFADCYSLTSVTLEEGVTYINSFAFEDCTALEEIVIPNSMTKISNSFPGCTALKSVTIPVTVTEIYDGAFENCTALETVNYGGTRAQWNKITIGSDNECLTRCYKGHGFSPQFDGWSFCNTTPGFRYSNDYSIPEERYEEVFGKSYVATAKAAKDKVYESMMGKWGGNCLGMSTTAVLFYLGMLDWQEWNVYDNKTFEYVNDYYTKSGFYDNILNPSNYHTALTWSTKNSEITKLIERYQILQNGSSGGYVKVLSTKSKLDAYMSEGISSDGIFNTKYSKKHLPDGDYIRQVLEHIETTTEPLIVGMYTGSGLFNKSVGHAVVARTDKRPEKMEDGWYRVYIYDPNTPYLSDEEAVVQKHGYPLARYYMNNHSEDRYMELNPETNQWRYNGSTTGDGDTDYWGTDASGNVKYMNQEGYEDGKTYYMPDYMFVYSINHNKFPLKFDGTEAWLSAWAEETNIILLENANSTIMTADGAKICDVIDGVPFGYVDGISYHTNIGMTEDGIGTNGGKLTIPYTDFVLEYKSGEDISVIGLDSVVNIASTGNVSMDISINNGKVSVNSTDSSEIIMQVSDVYSNSEYTSVVADGTLDAGDTVTIQLKNDDFSAEFDGTGSLELTTDNEEAPESRVIGTLNEDNPKEDIDDVREQTTPSVPMYRMYDPNSGEHFYSGSEVERDFLIEAGWHYEGVGFNFPVEGAPVHRLYDPVYGEHLYTMDEAEMNKLLDKGWNYENVAFNSAGTDEVPQYRLHNPNEKRGAYHFTGSQEERDLLISVGWEYQGIGWYSCAE